MNVLDVPCSEWNAYHRTTVAEDNPEYPEDDDVATVAFKSDLHETFPGYSGTYPVPFDLINKLDIQHYSFPVSRLRCVGTVTNLQTIPVKKIQPSPYHSRSFELAGNKEFVESIAEAGKPLPKSPTVRPVDGGYEIVNGHKRLWASNAANLEQIPCYVVEIDDWEAAIAFVFNHLEGKYTVREGAVAMERLYEQWGDRIRTDLDIDDTYPRPWQDGAAQV